MSSPGSSTEPGASGKPARSPALFLTLGALGGLLVLGLFLAAAGVGAPSKTMSALAPTPPPAPIQSDSLQAEARLLSETAFFHPVSAAAPGLSVTGLDGKELRLSSLRGKVVLVSFWATWCPPCIEEMPSLLKLGRDLARAHPGDFALLAVSTDDTWGPVRTYFDKAFGGIPPELTLARDEGASAARATYCAARGYCPDVKFPESYIVGRDGRILAMVVGPRDWSDPAARQFLELLIGG